MTTYEGTTIDCGLKVKNGKIVTEPDMTAIHEQTQQLIQKLNAGPQPARIARERAFEDMKAKRRR